MNQKHRFLVSVIVVFFYSTLLYMKYLFNVNSLKTRETMIAIVIGDDSPQNLVSTINSLQTFEHQADIWIFSRKLENSHKNLIKKQKIPLQLSTGWKYSISMIHEVMATFALKNYEWLIYMQPGMEVTENWWSKVKAAQYQYPNAIISLSHKSHERENTSSKYYLQAFDNIMGSMWPKSNTETYLNEMSKIKVKKWYKWCYKRGILLLYVKPSPIMNKK